MSIGAEPGGVLPLQGAQLPSGPAAAPDAVEEVCTVEAACAGGDREAARAAPAPVVRIVRRVGLTCWIAQSWCLPSYGRTSART